MSRRYEAVYIFDSSLEDAAIQEKLTRFHGLLHATEEIGVEHWGRRQLAYKIGTRETGYYVIAKFHPARIRARDEARRRRRALPHYALRARGWRPTHGRG